MNPNTEIDSLENEASEDQAEDSISVDDFIRELEAKEKDLHITAETTIIEIAEAFDDGELPDFMKSEFPAEPTRQVMPATSHAEKPANTKLETENKQLKEKIAKLEDERTEMFKDSQRRAKEFANLKARVERERSETFERQIGNLAIQMLPALDNLDRAVDFARDLPHDEKSEVTQFFDGVVLVNQQVNEVLSRMGVEPIITVGETFDPHLHEAAATEETEEFAANTICGELLKGYRIGERVIRHSIVKVAKPPQGASEISKPENSDDSELNDSSQPAAEIDSAEPAPDETPE